MESNKRLTYNKKKYLTTCQEENNCKTHLKSRLFYENPYFELKKNVKWRLHPWLAADLVTENAFNVKKKQKKKHLYESSIAVNLNDIR